MHLSQDERIAVTILETVGKLLDEKPKAIQKVETDAQGWAEVVLNVASPLLERVSLPSSLAITLIRLIEEYPRSQLVDALMPAITRCLKHIVDFGKSPHLKKLLQVYMAAIYDNDDGEAMLRDYISSLHGFRSDCPHPRMLPNLTNLSLGGIHNR